MPKKDKVMCAVYVNCRCYRISIPLVPSVPHSFVQPRPLLFWWLFLRAFNTREFTSASASHTKCCCFHAITRTRDFNLNNSNNDTSDIHMYINVCAELYYGLGLSVCIYAMMWKTRAVPDVNIFPCSVHTTHNTQQAKTQTDKNVICKNGANMPSNNKINVHDAEISIWISFHTAASLSLPLFL